MLTYEARYPEAREQLGIAQSLQPASTAILADRALAIGLGGQRADGLHLLQQAAGENPLPSVRHDMAVLATVVPRDLPLWLEQRIFLSEASHSAGEIQIYREAQRVFNEGGEQAMWRSIETTCEKLQLHIPVLAEAQAALGQKDAAFATLFELQQHDGVRTLAMDPLLQTLRNDIRYTQLLAASGLPRS